jgi:calcineurin-like phosphoesterase family protein
VLVKTTLKELENTLFLSDSHFNHTAMLGYCNRPFNFVTEMNLHMVEEWNKRANNKTIIYHLGDVTLEGKETAQEFFGKLLGQIRVLEYSWHHDKRWLNKDVYYSKNGVPVQILPSTVILEVTDYFNTGWNLPITLYHNPIGDWDRKYHGAWHLHGHSHSNYIPPNSTDLILDVGVDSAYKILGKYAPFTFAEIDAIMRSRKN